VVWHLGVGSSQAQQGWVGCAVFGRWAREALLSSPHLPGGEDLERIFPICTPGSSDTALLDEVLELLQNDDVPAEYRENIRQVLRLLAEQARMALVNRGAALLVRDADAQDALVKTAIDLVNDTAA